MEAGQVLARHVLPPGEYIIGREAGVVLLLIVPLASRRHARLTINPAALFVEDLHSSNGTLLNGQPLSPGISTLIPSAGELRIGSATVTLRRLPAVPDAHLSPGWAAGDLLFGRYRLRRELGRGGMGVVLLAEDEELGIPVALKMVPELVVQDHQGFDELKREVLRGRALLHPGIVRTHNFARGTTSAAIVMVYVDGENLATLEGRQPGGCFDAAEVRPWLEQLCAVLVYAHQEAHIAHRDLKPANLMLTGEGRIKVADFGIAASLSDSISRISVRGDNSGTPAYMSPQQIMGEPSSRLDDIYALGATLYDLLTGKPPFHDGQILTQAIEGIAPTMNKRRLELGVAGKTLIPPEWEQTVAACLAKRPEDRPQNAGEVLALLRCEILIRPVGQQRADRRTAVPEFTKPATPPTKSTLLAWSPRMWIGASAGIAGLIAAGIFAAKSWRGNSAEPPWEAGSADIDFAPLTDISSPARTTPVPQSPLHALPESPPFTQLADGIHATLAPSIQNPPPPATHTPHSFRYKYQFEDPGYRIWSRTGDTWEEKSPNGTVKRFQSTVRDTIEGRPGSIVRTPGTEVFEVFVSDKQVPEPRIYWRRDKGKWTFLGRMEDLK